MDGVPCQKASTKRRFADVVLGTKLVLSIRMNGHIAYQDTDGARELDT